MSSTTPTQAATAAPALAAQLRALAELHPAFADELIECVDGIEWKARALKATPRERVLSALREGHWSIKHLRAATGLTAWKVGEELRRLGDEGAVEVRRPGGTREELYVPADPRDQK